MREGRDRTGRPRTGIAAPVTRGAVLCSAWLGVRLDSVETWNKSLETVALAGDDRETGDGKLADTERMEATKDQRRGPVEPRGMTGDEKPPLTGIVAEPRGSDAELAAGAEGAACAGQDAGNSEQAGRRRGIGKLGVRWRSRWESSWHRSRDNGARTPNDLKLSDCAGWRTCCAAGLLGAACVTAGAVRCSAWLGPWGPTCPERDSRGTQKGAYPGMPLGM